MTRGHTLLELTVVLLLLGLGGATMVAPARRQVDRAAVAGAREAVVGLFALARSEARLHGGACLRLRAADGRVWVEAGGATRSTLDLPGVFGVSLSIAGTEDDVSLLFDALGIGRRASRTLDLTRGSASTTLVVAAYGRVERR
ncbi:MAG: hypothetical protein KY453_01635 [Gemmatimonadetes bacterium]|nr:hypothetical protein [Gemmatimonadota bacterium]